MKRFLGSHIVMPGRSGSFSCCLILVALILAASLGGCMTIRSNPQPLPPVLTQEELRQPYVKIGVVECSKESLGGADGIAPADYDWAYGELRESARRLGADAVITPELRVEQNTFLLIPTSTIKAKGIAIRFR